jgi:hypothetical protein
VRRVTGSGNCLWAPCNDKVWQFNFRNGRSLSLGVLSQAHSCIQARVDMFQLAITWATDKMGPSFAFTRTFRELNCRITVFAIRKKTFMNIILHIFSSLSSTLDLFFYSENGGSRLVRNVSSTKLHEATFYILHSHCYENLKTPWSESASELYRP